MSPNFSTDELCGFMPFLICSNKKLCSFSALKLQNILSSHKIRYY